MDSFTSLLSVDLNTLSNPMTHLPTTNKVEDTRLVKTIWSTYVCMCVCVYARVRRVPGLPIRTCADISNNLVPRGTKVSATNVEAKAFFERLYLVPGLRKIAPFVTMPSAPTSPHLSICDYFSILVQFFSRVAPQFFLSARFAK